MRLLSLLCWALLLLPQGLALAQVQGPQPPLPPLPRVTLGFDRATQPGDVALTLQILALLTVLSLAPSIAMLLTSFTRIVVVLSVVRNALGLQQMPPNQLIVALSLFLTLFTMSPVVDRVNSEALQPFLRGEIPAQEAWGRALVPIRTFMLRQTGDEELRSFLEMAGFRGEVSREEVPMRVLMPAFVLSELKTAFKMGVLIYMPFIVVDMVVSSVLMAMGMIMLPPMIISLPFKLMLFVLVDGWNLLVRGLVQSFNL